MIFEPRALLHPQSCCQTFAFVSPWKIISNATSADDYIISSTRLYYIIVYDLFFISRENYVKRLIKKKKKYDILRFSWPTNYRRFERLVFAGTRVYFIIFTGFSIRFRSDDNERHLSSSVITTIRHAHSLRFFFVFVFSKSYKAVHRQCNCNRNVRRYQFYIILCGKKKKPT